MDRDVCGSATTRGKWHLFRTYAGWMIACRALARPALTLGLAAFLCIAFLALPNGDIDRQYIANQLVFAAVTHVVWWFGDRGQRKPQGWEGNTMSPTEAKRLTPLEQQVLNLKEAVADHKAINERTSLGVANLERIAAKGGGAWHTRLVQTGKRRFFSWALVWEVPTVYFTYLVGVGIADHLGWKGPAAGAAIAVISYFGPGGIQALLQTYASVRGKIDAGT